MIAEVYIAAHTHKSLDVSGIACIIRTKNGDTEHSKVLDAMTQNQADIEALVYALEMLPYTEHVSVYSNSQLVVNCANGTWGRNSNTELWERFDTVSDGLSIELTWVKKNSRPMNTQAHRLARESAYRKAA